MQWHQLWYVLAGLIIGLTASTLWEWLYFRRKRMALRDRRLLELEAEARLLREQNRELAQLVAARPPAAGGDYHSPPVFLENEEAESLRDDAADGVANGEGAAGAEDVSGDDAGEEDA